MKEWEWYFRIIKIMKQAGKIKSSAFSNHFPISFSFYCQTYKGWSTCYLNFLSASSATILFNQYLHCHPLLNLNYSFQKVTMTPCLLNIINLSHFFCTVSYCWPIPPAWSPFFFWLQRYYTFMANSMSNQVPKWSWRECICWVNKLDYSFASLIPYFLSYWPHSSSLPG